MFDNTVLLDHVFFKTYSSDIFDDVPSKDRKKVRKYLECLTGDVGIHTDAHEHILAGYNKLRGTSFEVITYLGGNRFKVGDCSKYYQQWIRQLHRIKLMQ
jgi:hypothetical protein